MDSQQQLVTQQFGRSAAAYATSPTHADAAVLADLVALVNPQPTDRVLDIATGAGNVALACAACTAEVVAYDLTPEMLQETARRAAELGLANVTTVQGPAEKLPFEDASFDVVCVRTAPHHFSDIRAAVAEMERVVKPGGKVLIVDTYAPEEPDLDAQLNAIEVLRDPSHVRNYRPSEWRAFLAEVGLDVTHERLHSHALGKRMLFSEWTGRMHVSEEDSAKLRELFASAAPALKAMMELSEEEDFSFTLPEITLLASPTTS